MTKQNQIIFMSGKEKALKSLFSGGENAAFGYLAVGYSPNGEGFEDAEATEDLTALGFQELDGTNDYKRVELVPVTNGVEKDQDTNKVLVKFEATLDENNIKNSQPINQLAIVDSGNIGQNTNIYSATTFNKFEKSSESLITFVIGFRL